MVLWLLSRFETLTQHWEEIQEEDVLPVTPNFQIASRLEEQCKKFIALEERLSLQECKWGDEVVRRIMREWHIYQGTDWTEVDGLSLGHLCEYDLLCHNEYSTDSFTASQGFTPFVKAALQFQSLFEEYSPSQIKHDYIENAPLRALQLVASHYGTTLQFIGEQKPVSQGQQSTSGRGLKSVLDTASFWKRYAIYGYNALKKRSSQAESVYAVYYHNFELVLAEIRNAGFILHTDTECRQRIAWLKSRSNRRAKELISPLHERWASIKNDPVLKRLFTINGIDYSAFFHEEVELQLNTWFPDHLSTSLALRQVFKELGITSVLVPFDAPAVARVVVLSAQLDKIPSVVVQHGLFASQDLIDELRTADYALVVSDEDKTRLKPKNKVDVVGCLQCDKYGIVPQAPVTIDKEPIRFLILTYSPSALSVCNHSTWPAEYLQMVVDVFNQSGTQAHVTLKPHPSESLSKYEALLAKMHPSFAIDFASGWTMPSLLPQCDVLITPVSTAIAEASALRKPTVLFTFEGDIKPFWNNDNNIPSASDFQSLRKHVQSAIDGYERFYAQYDWDVIQQRLGVAGNSAERIADVLKGISENRL